MGDFLHTNANTPCFENFRGPGRTYRVATNSTEILAALRMTFAPAEKIGSRPAFRMRFWVDTNTRVGPPWPRPYIRGWDDLIYASFAPGNFGVIDLDSHRIVARFSPEMASDTSHWNRVILPMLMSIIAGATGAVELHSACVAIGERGLLLSGPTGSGKSTLAMALASLGCRFLCDDRILCWSEGRQFWAWTPRTDLKLRREAMAWFTHLNRSQASAIEVQQGALRVLPESVPGITRLRSCQPSALLFLEPTSAVRFELAGVSRQEAESRLTCGLLAESAKFAQQQYRLIQRLGRLPCYKVRYGGDPWTVAEGIISCFHDWKAKPEPGRSKPSKIDPQLGASVFRKRHQNQRSASEPRHHGNARLDALGRFLPVAHREVVHIMGKRIAVETNRADLLDHLRRLFSRYASSDLPPISFRWRIMVQPDASSALNAYKRFAFSDPGIRFAQFGQRNFLAVDLRRSRAVAFVTEQMASDEVAFTTPFLDSLFCMCSSSLGFLSLLSSSVAVDGHGVLILGAPQNGKTTASYILAKSGMELVGDAGVFVERHGGGLRAWGGFWPIKFRADAPEFFPELKHQAKPFAYHEFTYFHLDKSALDNRRSQTVVPVACVFLERLASSRVSVSALQPAELVRRVEDSLLFDEERGFRRQQLAIAARLAKLPGYRIAYGVDPADAAVTIRKLLVDHLPTATP